ncbi:hypothetical protein ACKVWM_011400 [Pyricularia oryzae]
MNNHSNVDSDPVDSSQESRAILEEIYRRIREEHNRIENNHNGTPASVIGTDVSGASQASLEKTYRQMQQERERLKKDQGAAAASVVGTDMSSASRTSLQKTLGQMEQRRPNNTGVTITPALPNIRTRAKPDAPKIDQCDAAAPPGGSDSGSGSGTRTRTRTHSCTPGRKRMKEKESGKKHVLGLKCHVSMLIQHFHRLKYALT